MVSFYPSLIIRRIWRSPPSKGVDKKTRRHSLATSGPIIRAPIEIMFASLCNLAKRAVVTS